MGGMGSLKQNGCAIGHQSGDLRGQHEVASVAGPQVRSSAVSSGIGSRELGLRKFRSCDIPSGDSRSSSSQESYGGRSSGQRRYEYVDLVRRMVSIGVSGWRVQVIPRPDLALDFPPPDGGGGGAQPPFYLGA